MAAGDEVPRPGAVIAIDPGRAKCGIALVRRDGGVVRRAVVATADLVATVVAWQGDPAATIVLGRGTASRPILAALRAAGIEPALVEEQATSLRARERYFREHPPRGWRRWLPRGLLVPPEPWDDYAAILIAETYFAQEGGSQTGK